MHHRQANIESSHLLPLPAEELWLQAHILEALLLLTPWETGFTAQQWPMAPPRIEENEAEADRHGSACNSMVSSKCGDTNPLPYTPTPGVVLKHTVWFPNHKS